MADINKHYNTSTIIFIVLLVCIVLFFIFTVIFKYIMNKEFKNRCESIQKSGEPITYRDLANSYCQVPDSENAALLYEDMLSVYKDYDDVYSLYVKQAISKGIPEEKREFKKVNDFTAKILFFDPYPNLIRDNKLPKDVAFATSLFLKANKRCLEFVGKTEKFKKFSLNYDFANGYSMHFPEIYSQCSCFLCDLFAADMVYSSFQGKDERVLADFKESMKMGSFFLKEPFFLSFLYGKGVEERALDALQMSYYQIHFSDSQLKEIESILKSQIKTLSFYNALLSDRIMYLECIDDYYKRDKRLFYKIANFIEPFVGVHTFWKLKILDIYDQLFKIIKEKDAVKKLKGFNSFERMIDNLPYIYKPVKEIVDGSRIIIYKWDFVAHLNTALIAIEIERYRLKYHKLPKKLNDLVPEFLEELPIDPYSGKLYKYHIGNFRINIADHSYITKNGFIVYSVGRNRIDNAGLDDIYKRDIVYWVINKPVDKELNNSVSPSN